MNEIKLNADKNAKTLWSDQDGQDKKSTRAANGPSVLNITGP
jgi:hypothetical protein